MSQNESTRSPFPETAWLAAFALVFLALGAWDFYLHTFGRAELKLVPAVSEPLHNE